MSILSELEEKGIASPPKWLNSNIVYLTQVGSVAYGAADTNTNSDVDIYGICIPNREDVFPHLANKIIGFDSIDCFQQYQEHHLFHPETKKEYDFSIYCIVKFFKLLMENNPSIIDTLFTPQECVLQITKVGNLIRENRKLFLHKGCFAKFKGYGLSMLHKMRSKSPEDGSKRANLREKYGFDIKYGMHLVRLLGECEQILEEGDLNLRKNSEQLKSIRRGEMSEQDIMKWAENKEKHLENLYAKSTLPYGPNKDLIKNLLITCLEMHYGSLQNIVVRQNHYLITLKKIKEEIEKSGI